MCRLLLLAALLLAASRPAIGQGDDPGAEEIGRVRAEVFYGSDGDLKALGARGEPLAAAEANRLRASKELRFASYRKLGEDRKPVWRAFENWAMPMHPSEEIMVSFEPKGLEQDGLRLDLKLWLRKREVLTALPLLQKGKKLYILGPGWRGGRLIIAVELLGLSP
jgi:hypothetical protein